MIRLCLFCDRTGRKILKINFAEVIKLSTFAVPNETGKHAGERKALKVRKKIEIITAKAVAIDSQTETGRRKSSLKKCQ